MSYAPETQSESQFTGASAGKLLQRVIEMVPPSWPLNQWIAVNPWWGVRHLPAERASQIPGSRADTSLFMPLTHYHEAWIGGRIQEEDLRIAMAEFGAEFSVCELTEFLGRDGVFPGRPAPLMLDQLQASRHFSATESVREQVARACGLFFDDRQASWLGVTDGSALFESWLDQTLGDVTLDQRVNLRKARHTIKSLSRKSMEATDWAIKTLGLSEKDLESLGQRLVFELPGWASWCRGKDWRASLEGRESRVGEQLVAILLVWEAVAFTGATPDERLAWRKSWRRFNDYNCSQGKPANSQRCLWIWHRALEIGYQRGLSKALSSSGLINEVSDANNKTPDLQAVFCIDVRSEVLRRHLETVHSGVQTIGFAGFFGIPTSFQSLGPEQETHRLPGLLAPSYRLTESSGNQYRDYRLRRASNQVAMLRQSVRKAKYSSLSSFTLVESTGMAWAWKLVRDSLNLGKKSVEKSPHALGRLHHRTGGDPVSDLERTQLAENLLRGMSLTSNFAPLLLFVGHGSHSENNPHRASLACGACGGQNGGLNACVAAELINDPVIRAGLARRGIRIPDFTLAIAAEHCTVTDTLTVMGRESIPDAYLDRLIQMEHSFAEAGARTRRERATALGLNGLGDEALLSAMEKRSISWSEVRPEWGLANNASIIFAKRSVTKGLNLGGRAFLHDYDPSLDPQGDILEALMTAPMVVASWINLQYLGSVAAPATFGAGNKLLHSVVGGNIGVVEGNDPDLRVGIPKQSVHDGERWRHEPLRLSVVIDAPRDRIDRIIACQPDVARLVENRWLWLFRLTDSGTELYRDGSWVAFSSG
ncbi:YbcC family protein [Marinobacter sp. F4206]|uniref:YbcC family protein n=1 Tax=Marinobacter sp. F4206 TaxID=2861777 RepID=UPI001C5CD81F|nr:DUF2309 domain-containing protein [Marinobacter sp. F4206]MBW4933095.1 DUF2309 domain-containing protein [Marinobacter sp. F4206]